MTHEFLDLSRHDGGMGNGVGCRLAIGDDESAGAQVYPSIVTHDDDEDIGQLVAVDLSEDGFPCR